MNDQIKIENVQFQTQKFGQFRTNIKKLLQPSQNIFSKMKPENTHSYNLEKESSSAYVNKAFVSNEKTVIPPLEWEEDAKPGLQQKVIDFDDLLPHLGEFGRYQKILFLLMIPFAFFVAFVYFSQIFITLVPEEHWCAIPELSHLTAEQR